MIVQLEPNANWLGTPIDKMNVRELKLILAYKLCELRAADAVMDTDQKESVKAAMKSVHVPLVVRDKKSG